MTLDRHFSYCKSLDNNVRYQTISVQTSTSSVEFRHLSLISWMQLVSLLLTSVSATLAVVRRTGADNLMTWLQLGTRRARINRSQTTWKREQLRLDVDLWPVRGVTTANHGWLVLAGHVVRSVWIFVSLQSALRHSFVVLRRYQSGPAKCKLISNTRRKSTSQIRRN